MLVRRLGKDSEAHHTAVRYASIGDALRGTAVERHPGEFRRRVMAAIGGVEEQDSAAAPQSLLNRLLWPAAGVGVAAAVAVLALTGLQTSTQESTGSSGGLEPAVAEFSVPGLGNQGPSYTVPETVELGVMTPPARVTNYLVSHGEYMATPGRNRMHSRIVADDAAPAEDDDQADSNKNP